MKIAKVTFDLSGLTMAEDSEQSVKPVANLASVKSTVRLMEAVDPEPTEKTLDVLALGADGAYHYTVVKDGETIDVGFSPVMPFEDAYQVFISFYSRNAVSIYIDGNDVSDNLFVDKQGIREQIINFTISAEDFMSEFTLRIADQPQED